MDNYEINEETIALLPISEEITQVYEVDNSFLINKEANKIIEDSCEYFGSSYEGRKKGTTNLTGITHKVPIIVEESKSIIFFPISSPRLKDCAWIALNHIDSYKKEDIYSVVNFKNNKNLLLKVSFGSFDNQVLRATKLESMFRNRKNEIKKHNTYDKED
ncbi:MAG: competence protein ComK [Bacilli bacterium]